MIQRVGFSAGNWNKEIAVLKAQSKALTQGVLNEMTKKGYPKIGAVDFITLTPRGQFKGAVFKDKKL